MVPIQVVTAIVVAAVVPPGEGPGVIGVADIECRGVGGRVGRWVIPLLSGTGSFFRGLGLYVKEQGLDELLSEPGLSQVGYAPSCQEDSGLVGPNEGKDRIVTEPAFAHANDVHSGRFVIGPERQARSKCERPHEDDGRETRIHSAPAFQEPPHQGDCKSRPILLGTILGKGIRP
jgi:hypothetical protein